VLGNLYVLVGYNYYYSSLFDLDNDGSWSNMLLLKYDSDLKLSWAVEDFSNIQASHGSIGLSSMRLELTESGVPFVFSKTREKNFLGKSAIGSGSYYDYDYAGFSFDAVTGDALSYQRFGSNGDDDGNFITSPYQTDQMLAYYAVDSGDEVNGTSADDSMASAQVIFDAGGAVVSEELVVTSGIKAVYKAANEQYFIFEGQGYYNTSNLVSILDSALVKTISKNFVAYNNSYRSPLTQKPVLVGDGSYYFVNSANNIDKVTSNLAYRK